MKPNNQQDAFRLLLGYVYRDRPLLIKAMLLLLLATAADVAGPYLAKVFIDDYLMHARFEWQALLGLLLGYLFTQVAAAILRYQQTLKFSEMALAAVLDIRKQVFARVLRLPQSYFDTAVTGQLVSRITNDTEAIKDLYVQFLSSVLANAILLLGILIAMALLDLRLMLISLTLIPAVVGIILIYQRKSGPAVEQARQLRSDINANLGESVAGMSVIQAANQQARFRQRFAQTNEGYYAAKMSTIRVGAALLRPAIDFLSVLILVAILWGFGSQAVSGVAEVGILYAFVSYLGRFTEPLIEITQKFNLYQQAMVAGGRVYQLLHRQEVDYGHYQQPISRGEISIEQLSFSYDGQHPVLRELNIQVRAGEWLAIVGHTGSGKSTLLSLLLGFYHPTAGQIRLDGVALQDYQQTTLRTGIGLIPQEPFVLADTLFANIDMGRGLSQQQVEQAAKDAHLHDTIMQMADGYQSVLGERGTRLSTGQRQQLAIARALASHPQILLLDEATANIDSETEQVVQRALTALRGKVTLVVVAHRLSTIKEADRILVLHQGEVVEEGNHQQLMALEDGRYQRMYLLQMQAQVLHQLEVAKDLD